MNDQILEIKHLHFLEKRKSTQLKPVFRHLRNKYSNFLSKFREILENVSIFGVSIFGVKIFDYIFPKFFGRKLTF